MRTTTLRRALMLAVVAVLALTATACDTPPSEDAFYQSPAPITGSPGDVLRSRASTATTDPLNQTQIANTRSWQVVYRSQDALGNATAVSGTVIVPTTPWLFGKRPIVAVAPGTRGVGDDCAPSYTMSQGTDYEGINISLLLQQGWAVALTDYQGLGMRPGLHTYMVGQTLGKNLIDVARAAQRLPGTGLDATSPVGFMGYSEGGAASGWAAQLAASYGAGLNVKGVVAGGVPADLTAVADALDGSPFVALALMAAMGLDAQYPELDLETYVNDRGADLLAASQEMCIASFDGVSTLVTTAFTHLDDYVEAVNPLETPAWQARLTQNKLGATKPAVPVYQFHASLDEMVAFPQGKALRDAWCGKGANVTWSEIPLAEHVLGMELGLPGALTFLTGRFAGLPTSGNC